MFDGFKQKSLNFAVSDKLDKRPVLWSSDVNITDTFQND